VLAAKPAPDASGVQAGDRSIVGVTGPSPSDPGLLVFHHAGAAPDRAERWVLADVTSAIGSAGYAITRAIGDGRRVEVVELHVEPTEHHEAIVRRLVGDLANALRSGGCDLLLAYAPLHAPDTIALLHAAGMRATHVDGDAQPCPCGRPRCESIAFELAL